MPDRKMFMQLLLLVSFVGVVSAVAAGIAVTSLLLTVEPQRIDYATLVEHILELNDPPYIRAHGETICLVEGGLVFRGPQVEHGPYKATLCADVRVLREDDSIEEPFD